MKKGIHPGYFNTKIICACGNIIETRASFHCLRPLAS